MEFGNEKVLPAGPLREGLENLQRADKVIKVSKGADPSADCRMEPEYVYNIKTGKCLPDGASVTAISAIGQPQQFYDFLKGYNVVKTVTFDDHHDYELKDIAGISGNIVTTEKDAVKLQKFGRGNIYALKLKTVLDVEALLSSPLPLGEG
jgi:tetraacyldisaccharide 4'-kinase